MLSTTSSSSYSSLSIRGANQSHGHANCTTNVQDRTEGKKVMENTSHTRSEMDPEGVDSFRLISSKHLNGVWPAWILGPSHAPKRSLHKTSIPRRVWNHTNFGTALRSMISMYKLACSATLRPCQPAKIESNIVLHRLNWPGAMGNSSIFAT